MLLIFAVAAQIAGAQPPPGFYCIPGSGVCYPTTSVQVAPVGVVTLPYPPCGTPEAKLSNACTPWKIDHGPPPQPERQGERH